MKKLKLLNRANERLASHPKIDAASRPKARLAKLHVGLVAFSQPLFRNMHAKFNFELLQPSIACHKPPDFLQAWEWVMGMRRFFLVGAAFLFVLIF
jgi:hypothetical protein